ncbi:MAG TPA: hypothetical protein VK763_00900 [Terriglobales bacterium]|jgi:hypothetical protein|nr:hypothetical protein [Terriglobales bacterium]
MDVKLEVTGQKAEVKSKAKRSSYRYRFFPGRVVGFYILIHQLDELIAALSHPGCGIMRP